MVFTAANMSTGQGDEQWFRSVQAAFADEDICARIYQEASHAPTRLPALFEEMSRYVLSVKKGQTPHDVSVNSKKRKLEESIDGIVVTFECKDVSFQIPARKKLKMQIVSDAKDQRRGEVRALNSTSDELEYALPADQIEHIVRLPVPEKQARQTYLAIFPKGGATSADGMPAEHILFTLNDTAALEKVTRSGEDVLTEDDTYVTATQRALATLLAPHGKRVVAPSDAEFASSRPQPHRKGERAYHVNAYRGSKEGYLFFLANGIVFGFKKPLAFFPTSSVESISYTSVLQRTFNLVIAARETDAAEVKEVEFSMLDQEDFAGIDEYIKRHGLNDASMAAERRAKAYNINKEKKAEMNGDATAGTEVDDQTELQKAEQHLQDDEDEEEEDYEDSGSDSDGSGAYSEDEDEDEYGDEGDAEGAEEAELEQDGHDE